MACAFTEYVGPGQVRKVLQEGNKYIPELVLVFDEFDRLKHEHRAMFADTIKDIYPIASTCATVILVGVASDVSELIAEHVSVARNLAEIKMPPMTRTEVEKIINNGLGTLSMTMARVLGAFETITTLSQGFPHYTHLLGKESALAAIGNRRFNINEADVSIAIRESLKDNSYNVADIYQIKQRRLVPQRYTI